MVLTGRQRGVTMDNEIRELNIDDLAAVSGGMNWDWPDHYVDKNVIDARGGQTTVWGFTVTHDVNGKVSSVTRT
jgi:hypothetical protein